MTLISGPFEHCEFGQQFAFPQNCGRSSTTDHIPTLIQQRATMVILSGSCPGTSDVSYHCINERGQRLRQELAAQGDMLCTCAWHHIGP